VCFSVESQKDIIDDDGVVTEISKHIEGEDTHSSCVLKQPFIARHMNDMQLVSYRQLLNSPRVTDTFFFDYHLPTNLCGLRSYNNKHHLQLLLRHSLFIRKKRVLVI